MSTYYHIPKFEQSESLNKSFWDGKNTFRNRRDLEIYNDTSNLGNDIRFSRTDANLIKAKSGFQVPEDLIGGVIFTTCASFWTKLWALLMTASVKKTLYKTRMNNFWIKVHQGQLNKTASCGTKTYSTTQLTKSWNIAFRICSTKVFHQPSTEIRCGRHWKSLVVFRA